MIPNMRVPSALEELYPGLAEAIVTRTRYATEELQGSSQGHISTTNLFGGTSAPNCRVQMEFSPAREQRRLGF